MKKDWYISLSNTQDVIIETNFTEYKRDPLFHPEMLRGIPTKREGFYISRCKIDGWEFDLIQDHIGLIQLRVLDAGTRESQFRIQLTMLLWQSRERPLWSPQQGMEWDGQEQNNWVSFGGNDKWRPLGKKEVRAIFEKHL